jgi:protein TonB
VGGTVRQPQKVYDVKPVYPQLALISRVEGVVIIEATIGADGRVVNARVLRTAHLLDSAALEAVRQWEFTPTLLNGVPVPVIMTVTVAFQLGR